MGGRAAAAHCDHSSQEPRPFKEETRPLPPDQKPTPASTPAQTAPNWGNYWKRTITTVVCLYGKLYLAFVAPSGDLLYTLFIFIRQLN